MMDYEHLLKLYTNTVKQYNLLQIKYITLLNKLKKLELESEIKDVRSNKALGE